MAILETNYQFLAGGSMATSAATLHNLFVSSGYGGLSGLNANEVLLVKLGSSNSRVRAGFNFSGAQPFAFNAIVIAPSGVEELPPILRSDASQIVVLREAGENAVVFWQVWRRRE